MASSIIFVTCGQMFRSNFHFSLRKNILCRPTLVVNGFSSLVLLLITVQSMENSITKDR